MRLHLLVPLLAAAVTPAADGGITYEGSSTVYPIIVAAAERYAETDPRFTLEAKPTGSSAGFRAMVARSCTINGASRSINAKEIASAKEGFIEVPIAFDALSVVTNPRNPWLRELTVAELQTLYAANGPTTWKQVRASFPEAKVVLFGAGADSGTADYFHEAIVSKDRRFRPDITVSEDDHVLVQGIAADVNSIGYMGLAYLIENAQALRAVAINSGKGPVMPTRQGVLDGTYTPLSRPIFVYLRPESLARQDVVGFIDFLIDKPEVIESVGYVALPPAMRAKIKERFAKRTAGSVFTSAAVGMTLAQAMGVEAAADAPRPPVAIAAPVPAVAPPAAKPALPAWSGPGGSKYQQDLERLRAASVDLARRSLEDGATLEEIVRRSGELKQQAEALAAAFRGAPRGGSGGLSLAEAAALAK